MNRCSECGGIGECKVGCAGPPKPKRINVAVNADEVAALRAVMARDGVTLTEAVRRLIGYGEVVWRTVKVDGQSVLLADMAKGTTREVVIP